MGEKTVAVRLYGKNDLRLESFELSDLKDDEILAAVVSNSVCMSSHKAMLQGAEHKRVPADIAENPVILGHEMCGEILEAGKKYKDIYKPGMKYTIQPALNIPGKETIAVGYSFSEIGGNATKVIVPCEVIERDCLIPCETDAFYKASLAEPIACILRALKDQFHYGQNQDEHQMGILEGGNLAILGGAGPMGLAMIDILINMDKKPKRILLTDINRRRLERAENLFREEKDIELMFVNTGIVSIEDILSKTDGHGFDDVFIFSPVKELVAQAGSLTAIGGCLNFFAGPADKNFSAEINFYDVHYNRHHIIGSAGSNAQDLLDAVDMINSNRINPAIMITHVGGLDSAVETIKNLPKIAGGKKLIYTGISMPLTALDDFEKLGKKNKIFRDLAGIIKQKNGLWCKEAEDYLLQNAKWIK